MPFPQLRNRHRRIQYASIFIAVLMIHIIVIQTVWSHPVNTFTQRENISFLESFAIQTAETFQAEDAIQSKDKDPGKTNTQDHFPETSEKKITSLFPSVSTETSNSTRHATPHPIQHEGIHTSQDSIAKKTKTSHTTRHSNSIIHKTDDAQASITSPDAHAGLLNNPPPPYPRQSRRLGEQGKVVLAAEIATNGMALQAFVHISSGYPRLDRAALESVKKWQFTPSKKAGVPQKMWVNIPINFVLE